jgi:hypothetical protein
MDEKRKSRDGHARKSAKGKPATVEAAKEEPSAPPREYDPKPIVEKLDVWSLNGKDRYFFKDEERQRVLSVNEKDVKRKLRLVGIHSRAGEGKPHSQTDVVMDYILHERSVDYAGALSGQRVGIVTAQGRRILVTSAQPLIEPHAGDWPLLRAVLDGMLKTPEEDQTRWLFAWLKVGYEARRKGVPRVGHGLILAGPHNSGKSFIQENLATPLFGGRSADPTKYLLGKTTFNSEMAAAEHLMMEELPSGLDFESRVMLGDELKRLITANSFALHPKYCEPLTIFPWWRWSLSINNNVDKMKSLPPLTSDFGDKILLLLCQSCPMPMATESTEERDAFVAAIRAELPAFAAFLLAWEIPPELRATKHAARFGHDHFHHPQLTAGLFEQEPENSLLYILDHTPALYDHGAWGWKAAEGLREELTDLSEQARRLFASKKGSFNGACGTFLSRLSEKFPDRFKSRHTNTGNVWLIAPPPA